MRPILLLLGENTIQLLNLKLTLQTERIERPKLDWSYNQQHQQPIQLTILTTKQSFEILPTIYELWQQTRDKQTLVSLQHNNQGNSEQQIYSHYRVLNIMFQILIPSRPLPRRQYPASDVIPNEPILTRRTASPAFICLLCIYIYIYIYLYITIYGANKS